MSGRTVSSPTELIDRHVASLSSRLDGPRRLKADMLREVRHGLSDTARAYEDDGVEPGEAASLAVEEFGDADEVAADFQSELVDRQTRHALAFMAIIGPVGETISRIQWSNAPMPAQRPPEFTFVLARAVDILGWSTSLVAILLLLAMGFWATRFSFHTRLAKLVACGIVAKVALLAVCGVALGSLFGIPSSDQTDATILALVYGVVHPAASLYAIWLAWRCFRTAASAKLLAN